MSVGAAAAAVAGAAAYSSFLAGPALGSRLSVGYSFVSELEAAGQPHRELIRGTDVLSGMLIVLVAFVLAHRITRRDAAAAPRARAGCALIAMMGVASVTDGATRMGCAPSLDAACRAEDSSITGLLSQVFEAHTLSGLAGFVGGSVGALLVGLAVRPTARGWGTASAVAGGLLSVVGLVDVGLLAAAGPFGWAERARALLVSGWLVGAGGYFLRDRRRAAGRPRIRPGRRPGRTHTYRRTGSRITADGSIPGSAAGQA